MTLLKSVQASIKHRPDINMHASSTTTAHEHHQHQHLHDDDDDHNNCDATPQCKY